MKMEVCKMFVGGMFAMFLINWTPLVLTEECSAEDDIHCNKTFDNNKNFSLEFEMQMDENTNHQQLIPPRIKTHSPVSSLCAYLPYRIYKYIKSSYRPDLNDTNVSEDSPLLHAAKLGHEQQVAYLLSSGLNASTTGIFKRTALHWAAANGFNGIIMLLIVKDASINCKDKWGFTPLHLAVENDHKESVEILIKYGAMTNTKNLDGRTPLHDAARNGYFDLLPLLYSNTSIGKAKPYLTTPLHEATIGNHLEVVQYLISKNASLNAIDEMKRTPLHWAVFYNHVEIALLLISKGAGLNRKDCYGLSPLHISAMKGYKKLTELLIKNGAFKNSRTKKGHTPLHEAARNGQKEIVELLIKEGVELEKPGSEASDGSTPLFEAIEGGYSDIVEILINYGARFNVTNNMGKTPLHRAVEKDDRDIVSLLVHKGAEINVEDYWGYTPYAIACEKGNMEILQQLFVYCVCYNYTKHCQCLSVGNDVVELPTPCQCIVAKRINSEEEMISAALNMSVNFDKCPCFMIKSTVDDDFEGCPTVPQFDTTSKGLCLKASKTLNKKFNNNSKQIYCPPTSQSRNTINLTICLGHVVKFVKNTLDNSIIFH